MKIFTITLVCISLCGCSYFKSKMNDIKGSLIGNGYTIDTYDNYGNKVFETKGQKIKIIGNKVKESSYNSDGSVKETYSLSYPGGSCAGAAVRWPPGHCTGQQRGQAHSV